MLGCMVGSLPFEVDDWGQEDELAFLRLLGSRLEADYADGQLRSVEGQLRSVEDAVYEITRELVVTERDADLFGDDILDAGFFQDFLWDGPHMLLISVGTSLGLGFSDSVTVLDFSTEKVIPVRVPNEDLADGSGWRVLGAVERGDTTALRSVVKDYIDQGWLPHGMYVAPFVPRSDIEDAFTKTLDSGHVNDWESLAAVLADQEPGSNVSIETGDERAACLNTYLDGALHQW